VSILVVLDDCRKRTDLQLAVLALQEQISGKDDLMKPGRELIGECDVSILTSETKKKAAHLWVLSDMILLAKPTSKGSHTSVSRSKALRGGSSSSKIKSSKRAAYEYREHFLVSSAEVIDVPTIALGVADALLLVNTETRYTILLRTNTRDEKLALLQQLRAVKQQTQTPWPGVPRAAVR